jgi:hypothetical protein
VKQLLTLAHKDERKPKGNKEMKTVLSTTVSKKKKRKREQNTWRKTLPSSATQRIKEGGTKNNTRSVSVDFEFLFQKNILGRFLILSRFANM